MLWWNKIHVVKQIILVKKKKERKRKWAGKCCIMHAVKNRTIQLYVDRLISCGPWSYFLHPPSSLSLAWNWTVWFRLAPSLLSTVFCSKWGSSQTVFWFGLWSFCRELIINSIISEGEHMWKLPECLWHTVNVWWERGATWILLT
jgi:hypothetical protein